MFSATSGPASHTYFENAVGRLLAHPAGHYIAVEYHHGPRQLHELQAFLTHAGELIARWGWDKLLSPQATMPAFTSEEIAWLGAYWRTKSPQRTHLLYGALLLPHEVFAHLSWKGSLAKVEVFEADQ